MTVKQRYRKKSKYTKKTYNVHVERMIEWTKEEVKDNLYISGIKLTKHAMKRMRRDHGIHNLATATRQVKQWLKKAERLGTIVSYKGFINVLYAYNQIAIYLSPDLKRVVTINSYEVETVEDKRMRRIAERTSKDIKTVHLEKLQEIEEKESEQIQKMLNVEKKVSEARSLYAMIMELGKGHDRKQAIKKMISECNHELKIEAWKLFNIKMDKKKICKSLVILT